MTSLLPHKSATPGRGNFVLRTGQQVRVENDEVGQLPGFERTEFVAAIQDARVADRVLFAGLQRGFGAARRGRFLIPIRPKRRRAEPIER